MSFSINVMCPLSIVIWETYNIHFIVTQELKQLKHMIITSHNSASFTECQDHYGGGKNINCNISALSHFVRLITHSAVLQSFAP